MLNIITDGGRFWRLATSDGFALFPKGLYPSSAAVAAHLRAPVTEIERVKVPSASQDHPKHCHASCGCLVHYRYSTTDADGRILDACEGFRSAAEARRAASVALSCQPSREEAQGV